MVAAVIEWEAEAVVVAADAAATIDEGVAHVDAEADRHRPVTGTSTGAGVGADRVRAALASCAKAGASCAMRKATSSATARSTVEAAGQCTAGGQTATATVATDTIQAGGHRIQEAVHHPRIAATTTEEVATWVVAVDAWMDPRPGGATTADHHLRKTTTGHRPGGCTTADRLPRKRTGPVATAASATEE